MEEDPNAWQRRTRGNTIILVRLRPLGGLLSTHATRRRNTARRKNTRKSAIRAGLEPHQIRELVGASLAALGVFLAAGKEDRRAPPVHTERMYDALASAGKTPEEKLIQKGEGHGYYKTENNVNLYTKMLAFFDKYIGPKASVASTDAP